MQNVRSISDVIKHNKMRLCIKMHKLSKKTYLLEITFFSVSFSHLLILQIWWLLSFLHGAHSPQLSFRWQPMHSPHRFLFFFVCLSLLSDIIPSTTTKVIELHLYTSTRPYLPVTYANNCLLEYLRDIALGPHFGVTCGRFRLKPHQTLNRNRGHRF